MATDGARAQQSRSVEDMSRDLREQNRDDHVIDAQPHVDTGVSWKYRPRRPSDHS
jgi:hypothetical protein